MKLLFFLTSLAVSLAHAHPVYMGTGADGIYLADFNAETGILTEPILAAKYGAPGFLAIHPEKPILHCVGRDNTVASFTIAKDHSLTLLGSAPSGGIGPCHLAIDASGRTLAVANYGDGSFATIRLDAEGKPGDIVSLMKMEGSGPNEQRQTGPPCTRRLFRQREPFPLRARPRHRQGGDPKVRPRDLRPLR